jgi:hypothetical protein
MATRSPPASDPCMPWEGGSRAEGFLARSLFTAKDAKSRRRRMPARDPRLETRGRGPPPSWEIHPVCASDVSQEKIPGGAATPGPHETSDA